MSEKGGVQLRRKKLPLAGKTVTTNPCTMGSLQQQRCWQEMQHDHLESCDLSDQYSDIGYPTLPRPKTILSLSRASLPWSICNQASKLGGTIPLRVKKGRRTEFERQLHSICVDAAVSPVKVNGELQPHNAKLSKQTSLSGISDRLHSQGPGSSSAQGRPGTDGVVSEGNSIFSGGGEKPEIMNNHTKSKSKGTADTRGEEAGQQKSKKSRKPSKALSFSFGSGSERKRRTLGFLWRGEKKTLDRPSPVTPKSPILVSKKVKSLPPGHTIESKKVVHPKPNGSARTMYGSYQDVHMVNSPSWSIKQRPPPLQGLSSSLGQQLYHGTESESPQGNYSPASTPGMSLRHDASEPLPFNARSKESLKTSARSEASLEPSASETSLGQSEASRDTIGSPPSRRPSPGSLTSSPRQHGALDQQTSTTSEPATSIGRKLSDPVLSSLIASNSPKPSPRPRTLKKRNTFCVRPSRLNQSVEQEWVSGSGSSNHSVELPIAH